MVVSMTTTRSPRKRFGEELKQPTSSRKGQDSLTQDDAAAEEGGRDQAAAGSKDPATAADPPAEGNPAAATVDKDPRQQQGADVMSSN